MFLNKKCHLFLLIIIPIVTNAQKIQGNLKFKPDVFSTEILDSVSKNIYYNYTFSFDQKNKDRKKNTTTILQIGKDKIGFTDLNKFKYDSIVSLYSKKDFLNAKDLNEIMPLHKAIAFRKTIVKSVKNRDYILESDIYNKKYNFTEEIPEFKWQLNGNKKVILNYNCKEAVVNYEGRKWIAYYTEEIPLSDGPYLFEGLPGLILEIYDDKNEHHFLANAIDNKPGTIYLYNEKGILSVSKKEFYNAEKNYHENPGILMNAKVYSSPNVEDKTPLKSFPYNPIEL